MKTYKSKSSCLLANGWGGSTMKVQFHRSHPLGLHKMRKLDTVWGDGAFVNPNVLRTTCTNQTNNLISCRVRKRNCKSDTAYKLPHLAERSSVKNGLQFVH